MAKWTTFSDDFTAGLDTGKWNAAGTASVISGVADIPVLSDYSASFESVAANDLTASSLYWKLVRRPGQGTGTTEGILYLQGTGTPTNQEIGFYINGTTLQLHLKDGASPSDVNITYSATSHAWLRLTHSGTTVFWDTAPDSGSGTPGTWTNRRSATAPSWLTSTHLLFTAGYYGTETSPASMQIDGVNTTAGSTGGGGGGGTGIPTTPSVVNPGPSGNFSWRGLNWNKRTVGGAPSNSGIWDAANVIVSGDGIVTLRLTNPTGSAPHSAEMGSTALGYGYGEYWIVISKNMSGVHSNFVMGGLFTYDDTMAAWTSHREIDVCETSAWGGGTVNLEPGYFTDNPDHGAGIGVSNVVSSTPARNETVQTHYMKWEVGRITWKHWSGTDVTGTPFRTDTTTSNVPVPGNEQIVINVWDYDSGGSNIPQQDVVLLDFAFVPAGFTPPATVPVSKTLVIPYEARTKFAKLNVLPWEGTRAGTVAVTKTVVLPYEGRLGVASSKAMPYEARGRTASILLLPYEAAGNAPILVSKSVVIPWEAEHTTSPTPPPVIGSSSGMVEISEIPPSRVSISALTPSGRRYRWGHDEPDSRNAFNGLQYSSVAPGGFDTMDAVLPRKPGSDYPDLERLTTIQVISASGDVVGEYRLERTPLTSGNEMSIGASCGPWSNHMDDDKAVSQIYIDRSLDRWGDTTTPRKVKLGNGTYGAYFNPQNGSFNTSPGGQNASTGVISPATLMLAIGALNQATPSTLASPISIAETLYDAGDGNDIGAIYGDIYDALNMGAGWVSQAVLTNDEDVSTAPEVVAVPFSGPFGIAAAGAPRRYGLLQLYYSGAFVGNADWHLSYANLRVIGNFASYLATYGATQLQLQGADARLQGFLASDVVKHAIRTFAPKLVLKDNNIERSTLIIPQLSFPEKTTCSEIIRQSTRFSSPPIDWFVWEDREFHMYRQGSRGKNWRARIAPAKLTETGPAVDRLWNSVFVSFTDETGKTRLVGPPGSNLGVGYVSAALRDADPDNPANRLGISRRDVLTMGRSDKDIAIAVGNAFLQQAKLLDKSGAAQITGWIEDDRGNKHPYNAIRAGDSIRFVDAADTSYRRISKVTHNDQERTANLDLDAPPDSLEGLLERLSVGLVSLGTS